MNTTSNKKGKIKDINGPIVTIELPGVQNGEQVRIGSLGLYGEVISLEGNEALAQIYESTEMVRPGEPVEGLGHPLSVELGPGLIGGIFDGVQRPLEAMFLKAGDYHLEESIGQVRDQQGEIHHLKLYHRWPVRRPRPYQSRDNGVEPLITGQRILDTFFPLLKGSKCAVPGPFGAGKTVVQHQVARWANADIV
ncbi:MAG: V-type ATP synthase subunit A, partial [Candidatus Thiodiazotropha taylori]|nr:V-type ATP synthase subunit A [Candidatus Thiodiazotropha taylori]MCW4253956.1 V-type ATP synthase subunit A [Candidatus Thiodiazotropha taylori]